MRYVINYQLRSEEGIFNTEFIVKAEHEPAVMDSDILDLAFRDSVKFHKSGLGAITIISIKKAS